MKNSTLLAIDGNALLYRAYHAFPKDLTSPDGKPSGAIFGLAKLILSSIKTHQPDFVVVAFDLKAPTFRHLAYDKYKANRSAMPEDLVEQIERAHALVSALEIPIVAVEGFEADDCLATLTKQFPGRIVIVSGDRDLLQLVSDKVSLFVPASYPKTPKLYTPDLVKQEYGFGPELIIDYKGLRGDPSDNLPGILGVGEVTASKLIVEFGNLEAIIEAAKSDHPDLKKAVKQKILDHTDDAILSKELATLRYDAPIDFHEENSRLELLHPEELDHFFNQMNFRSLLRELPFNHTPEVTASTNNVFDDELEPILRAMETWGIMIDIPYLRTLETELSKEISHLKSSIFEISGEEFNLDSPAQLGVILYEKLSLPTTFVKKNKTGYSTDADTLKDFATDFPIAKLMLEYREIAKLLSTYIRPLPIMADSKSRLHTTYAPDTATGRLSSKNPNLQNIPVRSDLGKRIRRAFIASPGKILVAADYSQIELRVAAHLSGDPVMTEVFNAGGDFHAETAKRMNVDRRVAKIINFSILYGKGPYGFSQDMGISMKEAKEYIDNYFATFKVLKKYLDELKEKARIDGQLTTLFGRIRTFPQITAANANLRNAAEREAINFPIQGTAADILKKAMIDLSKEVDKKSQILLSVHDELVLETDIANLEKCQKTVKNCMESTCKLSVPLIVTTKNGHNWADMYDSSVKDLNKSAEEIFSI